MWIISHDNLRLLQDVQAITTQGEMRKVHIKHKTVATVQKMQK